MSMSINNDNKDMGSHNFLENYGVMLMMSRKQRVGQCSSEILPSRIGSEKVGIRTVVEPIP